MGMDKNPKQKLSNLNMSLKRQFIVSNSASEDYKDGIFSEVKKKKKKKEKQDMSKDKESTGTCNT
jgi:hypothetical protein